MCLVNKQCLLLKKKIIGGGNDSVSVYFRFNKRMSQCCVRGQVVALCHSLSSLLDEVPHIRDNHFVMGTAGETRSDDTLCPDPR